MTDDIVRTPGPRVAAVAGASRGLGLLIATELARRGYTVHACARDAAELDRAAGLVRDQGYQLRTRVVDVADQAAVATWVEQIVRDDGALLVAIHVAGVIEVGPLDAVPRQAFTEAVDTMLWGPVNLATAVLPHMRRARSGHIATIASVGGVVGVPHLIPYSHREVRSSRVGA